MSDYHFKEDTIAAVSTPPGRGAVGIIRLSGGRVLDVIRPLWVGRPLDQIPPRFLTLGGISNPAGELMDQVLLVRFLGPSSYTGEDQVELQCHGNPGLLSAILSLVIKQGARVAEPGEFTYRAFRNGRLTLLQAESVAELIEARGEWARRNALAALAEGGHEWVQSLMDALLDIWVPIEADLEFPTDDLDSIHLESYLPRIEDLKEKIEELDCRATRFAKLQEGFRVVIAGAPNVGKSSLLNALLGYSRALVTEIPGTTRDTLEELIEVEGIPIRLIDTAGLGEARDLLDAKGMERSREALTRADLAIVVVDSAATNPGLATPEAYLPPGSLPEGVPALLAANKSDLISVSSGWWSAEGAILVSAHTGEGLETLLRGLSEQLTGSGVVRLAERIMLNQRQGLALAKAREALSRCAENIRAGAPQELPATDLGDARRALEELSGKTIEADLLGSIFSRFCIGK
ncbi:MAG: tRNA uridine-5-carboxymethylaminomethyl(34) synthesis GTPase MnmE [Candidatus Omnitrophica bacterium]|nr:tRNA uridine-5-carboxymethylaminomethyl(34) synthesis GTPase MnmE [Candidatus Omnitrophota bacterium]